MPFLIPGAVAQRPAVPISPYDALAEPIGRSTPQPQAPGYPGIGELARNLGLR